MATFPHGTADPDRTGSVPARRTSAPARLAALVAGIAMVGLLSGCGSGNGASSAPQTLPGTAQPASGDHTTDSGESTPADPTGAATESPTAPGSGTTTPASSTTGSSSARCHTSELSASVGGNDPGAGQENFPIVLTNTSQRTCTLRGFPERRSSTRPASSWGPIPSVPRSHRRR